MLIPLVAAAFEVYAGAAAVAAAGGFAAMSAGAAVVAGLEIAGGVLSAAGALTGNKDLALIGTVMGLGAGVAGAFGAGSAANIDSAATAGD
ncbi:MAG: hypothetical protein H7276_17660, partial [Caulobacter sp.]|nr:hypothetical protein [Vitreoscilla sp.]